MRSNNISVLLVQISLVLTILIMLPGCISTSKNALNESTNNSNHYPKPRLESDIIGHTVSVNPKPGQKLSSIGHYFDVGITEMINANPNIKPDQLLLFKTINVPVQYILPPKKYRQGIVINVPELTRCATFHEYIVHNI